MEWKTLSQIEHRLYLFLLLTMTTNDDDDDDSDGDVKKHYWFALRQWKRREKTSLSWNNSWQIGLIIIECATIRNAMIYSACLPICWIVKRSNLRKRILVELKELELEYYQFEILARDTVNLFGKKFFDTRLWSDCLFLSAYLVLVLVFLCSNLHTFFILFSFNSDQPLFWPSIFRVFRFWLDFDWPRDFAVNKSYIGFSNLIPTTSEFN